MKQIIFSMKKDLVNYLHTKYGRCLKEGTIRLPMNSTLYYIVEELLAVSPRRSYVRPEGNIAFSIPSLGDVDNKKIVKYHVISRENARLLERRIEMEMRVELYDLMKENRRRNITYIKTLEEFMRKYNLMDTTEDSFLKGFQRWRKRLR